LLTVAQSAVIKHAALDGAILHLFQWSKTMTRKTYIGTPHKTKLKAELAQRITHMNAPLSLATRAWLVRAYAEGGALRSDTDTPLSLGIKGTLPIETRTNDELVSKLMPLDDLARSDISVRNTGAEPLTLGLVLRGIPYEPPGQVAGDLSISRRVINQQGDTLDLERVSLKLNDVLYVILTGKRDQDGSTDVDPVVLADPLPASFEIIDRDVFDLARNEGVGLRAVLPSDGKQGVLRMVEARDDQFLAVVKPAPRGDFQIGYSVRVVATGRFMHPGTIAEDLYRPEIAARTEDQTVQVARRAPPWDFGATFGSWLRHSHARAQSSLQSPSVSLLPLASACPIFPSSCLQRMGDCYGAISLRMADGA
jgi:hypothetical protein